MDKLNIIAISIIVILLGVLSLGLLTLNVPVNGFVVNPSKYLGNTWMIYKRYTTTPSIPGAKIEYYVRYMDPQQDSLIVIKIVFSNPTYATQYMAKLESVPPSSVSSMYLYQEGFVQEVALLNGNAVAEVIYVGTSTQVPTGALIGLAYHVVS